MQEPDYTDVDLGYKTQWELLSDIFAMLDYRLYLLYKYHQWLGPGNDMQNMLGLVVTREEFEHNLGKAAQSGLSEHIDEEESAQLELNDDLINERLSQTDSSDIPLLLLFRRFALNDFEKNCVTLAYAAQTDKKYEKLFAYLQDDITKKAPTTTLAVQLYADDGQSAALLMSTFMRRGSFVRLFDPKALAEGKLILTDTVCGFLAEGCLPELPGINMYHSGDESGELYTALEIAAELDKFMASPQRQAVILTGDAGRGKKYQIKRLMDRCNKNCLFVAVSDKNPVDTCERAETYARLADAYLCIEHIERLSDETGDEALIELFDWLAKADISSEKLFLLSRSTISRPLQWISVTLELPEPSPTEVLELFRGYFGDFPLEPDVLPEELAAKFRFSPGQIKNAVAQAKGLCALNGRGAIDNKTLHECCYKQVVHRLDALAVKVHPKFDWDDVVLPKMQKELMIQACSHIRNKHRVYDVWGFEKKVSYGRGLSMLFAGSPGTGKTMCAQVIAKQLNMEIYKIQISQIVSKYIGETEKNLHAVFAEAKKSNCILFFDECDAIFGKRSEVKDAQDRHANVEVAYLLQQIEEHEGVCIMATNLVQNIDAAFMRRITFVIHFPFPDPTMRKELYLRMLPDGAPVDEDIDWEFLAEKFELAGGNIKNIVLNAAFLAAQQGVPIGMRQLINAAVSELRKNEIIVVREDLCEYADYIN